RNSWKDFRNFHEPGFEQEKWPSFSCYIIEVKTSRTLIVCEKPSAASRVAAALDEEGSAFKRDSRGVPYFECSTKQGSVTVCSAIGHLYSVDAKGCVPRNTFPVWDVDWDPLNEMEPTSTSLARC